MKSACGFVPYLHIRSKETIIKKTKDILKAVVNS